MSRLVRLVTRLPLAAWFAVFYLGQLVLANLEVAHEVITIRDHQRPGIVGVPLRARTDLEITLLANLISFTPGTLSIEVSADRSTLFVHGLFIDSPAEFRQHIARMETHLLRVIR